MITNYKTPSPSAVENQQLADDQNEFYCRFENTNHTRSGQLSTQPLTPPATPLSPTPAIELSVSPSHRTLMNRYQSSISCTGTGTRTSSGFSAIEKHWKIRSSHRFYGLYASKMEKRCTWGTCNTDSRYPERIGNIIYFITFPESKPNRAKC